MSDTRELYNVFDELPPNVQQELQALDEIVYQQKQRIAELESRELGWVQSLSTMEADYHAERIRSDALFDQLTELREAAKEVYRISERDHVAWNRLSALLQEPPHPLPERS